MYSLISTPCRWILNKGLSLTYRTEVLRSRMQRCVEAAAAAADNDFWQVVSDTSTCLTCISTGLGSALPQLHPFGKQWTRQQKWLSCWWCWWWSVGQNSLKHLHFKLSFCFLEIIKGSGSVCHFLVKEEPVSSRHSVGKAQTDSKANKQTKKNPQMYLKNIFAYIETEVLILCGKLKKKKILVANCIYPVHFTYV